MPEKKEIDKTVIEKASPQTLFDTEEAATYLTLKGRVLPASMCKNRRAEDAGLTFSIDINSPSFLSVDLLSVLRRGKCPVEDFADEVLGGFHVSVPHHLTQCGVPPDEHFEHSLIVFGQCTRFESLEKSFQPPLDFFCHGQPSMSIPLLQRPHYPDAVS